MDTDAYPFIAYGVVMIPLAYVMIFPIGRGAMGLADGVILGTLVPFALVMLRYRALDRKAAQHMAHEGEEARAAG